MTVIFASGFETEDDTFTVEWTGKVEVGVGSSIIVEANNPYQGIKNSKSTAEVVSSKAYCFKTIAGQSEVFYEALFKVTTLPNADGKRTIPLDLLDMVRIKTAINLNLYNDAGTPKFKIIWTDDAGEQWQYVTGTPEINTYYRIQLHWKRASSAVASDGEITAWIDGVKKLDLTNVDNFDSVVAVDEVRFGAIYKTWVDAHVTFGDCVVVADEYIEAEAEAVVSSRVCREDIFR